MTRSAPHTEIDFTGCDVEDLRAVQHRAATLLRWHALIGDGFGESGFEPHVDLLAVLGTLETERLAAGLRLGRTLHGLIAFGLALAPRFDPAELDFEEALHLLLEMPTLILKHEAVGHGIDRAWNRSRGAAEEGAGLRPPVGGLELDDAGGQPPGEAREAAQDPFELIPSDDEIVFLRRILTWHPHLLSDLRATMRAASDFGQPAEAAEPSEPGDRRETRP